VLELDDGRCLWDSQAILAYLARRYGPEWLPEEPFALAQAMGWLAVAENEILYGLSRARAVKLFGRPWNLDQAQELGRAGLATMEGWLGSHEWLAAGRPTIADVACYPYVGLAPAGEVPLDPYPSVRAWMGRIQALPGYLDMAGIERV
jgi:glutathione S-transferase